MSKNKLKDITALNWLKDPAPVSDIVLTTRIRLARNLVNIAFAPRARLEDLKKSQALVDEVFFNYAYFKDKKTGKNKFTRLELDNLSAVDKNLLAEKYIASYAFIEEKGHRSVYFNKDASLSFMVNEEDHIRMQALLGGFQLDKAWNLINKLDDALEEKLDFAYNENLGYLSTCPTNLGTGLRASVMLHLPAVTMVNLISKIAPKILQLGLAVRGIYGEGTEAQGHLYQISNQVSLGLKEEDIIEKIESITLQLVEQEKQTRESVLKDLNLQIKDRVWRSLGILRSARMISVEEAMELLSMVRLGVAVKILPPVPARVLNELLLLIRPAYLQKMLGSVLEPLAVDKMRAQVLREKLEKY